MSKLARRHCSRLKKTALILHWMPFYLRYLIVCLHFLPENVYLSISCLKTVTLLNWMQLNFSFLSGTHILSTWKQKLSEGQPVRELPRETWSGYFHISYTDKNQPRIRIIFFSVFRHSEWSQLRISAGESSSQHLPSSQQEVCANVKLLHWGSCFYSAGSFLRCAPEEMESRADSTTHCVQAEGNGHPQHQVKQNEFLIWGFCWS